MQSDCIPQLYRQASEAADVTARKDAQRKLQVLAELSGLALAVLLNAHGISITQERNV